MRLTIKDISEASGFCRDTVRKYADTGAIPFQKDVNGWRIFDERSVEIAKKLAGTRQEPGRTRQQETKMLRKNSQDER